MTMQTVDDRYQLSARCTWQERRITELEHALLQKEREIQRRDEMLSVLERYADARIATLVGRPAARPAAADPLRASERWQTATDSMPREVSA